MDIDIKRRKPKKKQNITVNKVYSDYKQYFFFITIIVVLLVLLVFAQPSQHSGTQEGNADTLDGFDSSNFATKDDLNNITTIISTGVGISGSIVNDTDWNTSGNHLILNNASYDRVRIGGTDTPSKDLVIDSGDLTTEAFLLIRLGNENRFLKVGNDGNDESVISWDDNDELVFYTYVNAGSEALGEEQMRISNTGEVTANYFTGNGSGLTAINVSWYNMTDIPAGFADGTDDGGGGGTTYWADNNTLKRTDYKIFSINTSIFSTGLNWDGTSLSVVEIDPWFNASLSSRITPVWTAKWNSTSGNVFNQNLNTTDSVTFANITGNGSGLTGLDNLNWNNLTNIPSVFGGNIFNQDLNTTDSVTFSSVSGNGSGLTGLNNLNWNNITNMPLGFLDGTDDGGTPTYDKYVTVAKSGNANFTTIQAAIDSITVGTGEKYLIQIFPGNYSENVVLKNGINLQGAGAGITTISSSTGTTLTTGAYPTINFISDLTIKSYPSGINTAMAVEIISLLAHFDSVTFDVDIYNGHMDAINLSSGNAVFKGCSFQYTQTGTGGGYHNMINVSSSASFTILSGYANMNIAGITTSDYLLFLYESGTSINTIMSFVADLDAESASFAGHVEFWKQLGSSSDSSIQGSHIHLSTPSGTVDSLGAIYDLVGTGEIHSTGNRMLVEGFHVNYIGEVETESILFSHWDDIVAPNGTVGDGTYTYVNSPADGDIILSGIVVPNTLEQSSDYGATEIYDFNVMLMDTSTGDKTVTFPTPVNMAGFKDGRTITIYNVESNENLVFVDSNGNEIDGSADTYAIRPNGFVTFQKVGEDIRIINSHLTSIYAEATDYPDMTFHIDFSNTSSVTLSGTNIVSVLDEVNGWSGTTPNTDPTLVSNAQNGLSVAEWTVANSPINFGDREVHDNTAGKGLHIFIVCKPNFGGDSIFSKFFDGTANRAWDFQTSRTYIYEEPDASGTEATAHTPSTYGDWQIIDLSWTPGGYSRVYNNGFFRVQSAYVTNDIPTTTSDLVIGARDLTSADYYGQIGEIIVYSDVLSNGDRTTMVGSLGAKWDIEVATASVGVEVFWEREEATTTLSPITDGDHITTTGNITATAFYGDGSALTGIGGNLWNNVSYYLKSVLNPWMATWNTSYGWGDHSIQNYFDTDGNTTDDLTNGTWSKLFTTSNRSTLATILGWGDHSSQNYLDLDTYPNADTDSTDDFTNESQISLNYLMYNDLSNRYDDDDLNSVVFEISEAQCDLWSPGWISGGLITNNGNGTINVASGIGYARNTEGHFVKVDWDASGIIGDFTVQSTNYIYVDATGTIIKSYNPGNTSNIFLGAVYNMSGVCYVWTLPVRGADVDYWQNAYTSRGIGALVQEGCAVVVNGTTMPEITSGYVYTVSNRYTISGHTKFYRYYTTDDNTSWVMESFNNSIDVNRYDSVTGLASLGDRWKKDLMCIDYSNDVVYYIYGQKTYVNYSEAKDASLPSIPAILDSVSVYSCTFVVNSSVTSLNSYTQDVRPYFDRLFGTAQPAVSESTSSIDWSDILNRPSGLDDGDNVLSEAQVDTYADNNNYLDTDTDDIEDIGNGTWGKIFTANNRSTLATVFGWGNHAGLYSLLGHSHTPAGNIFDQDLNTTNAPTFVTVDTGQGANELFDMDQNVQTTDDVTFNEVDTTGNVNIDGTLYVETPAISGREVLALFNVSDGGNDHFGIGQGTSASNEFAPVFYGYKDSDDTPYSMSFRGMVDAANDAPGTGYQNFGIISIEGMRTDNPTDPNNGIWGQIQNRILLSVSNGPSATRTFPLLIHANNTAELIDLDVSNDARVQNDLHVLNNTTIDGTIKQSGGGTTWNTYVNATGVLVWEME